VLGIQTSKTNKDDYEKQKTYTESPAGRAARLLVAFMLLLVTFGANADSGDDICFPLYARAGAIPGNQDCASIAASRTSTGMGTYFCTANAQEVISRYCKGPDPVLPDDSCPVADPVFPANGNVMVSEADFASGDTSPLVFSRTYLSKPYDKTQTAMGSYWVNNWQRWLDLTAVNASTSKITAYRGDGQPLTFKRIDGAWAVPGTAGLSLTKAGDGYFYLKDELLGTTEAYSDTTGKFYSETTRTGVIRKVFYDDRQRLSSIAEWPADNVIQATATSIRLEYDNSDRVVTLVDPLGMPTSYAYDGKGNLASVTAPYGHVRQYLYEDARFPNALTGLKDESGSRVATWTYDSSARAISVTHPDTTRNVSLSYGSGTTTLGDMSGTSTYIF
jgi:YD repeat-containing protein